MTEQDTPAVVFDEVSLAFDDQVVLDKVSFIVPKGRMTTCSAPAARGSRSHSS